MRITGYQDSYDDKITEKKKNIQTWVENQQERMQKGDEKNQGRRNFSPKEKDNSQTLRKVLRIKTSIVKEYQKAIINKFWWGRNKRQPAQGGPQKGWTKWLYVCVQLN